MSILKKKLGQAGTGKVLWSRVIWSWFFKTIKSRHIALLEHLQPFCRAHLMLKNFGSVVLGSTQFFNPQMVSKFREFNPQAPGEPVKPVLG